MKVAASHVINAPRDAVWRALQDPAVLARTLPGCRTLEVVGPDRFAMTIHAGVASITGTYRGTVELTERSEPDSLRMKAEGAGAPGTISADTLVRLEAVDGGTRIDYDADAVVGGMIGGVGQRVLVGVTKKTAGEFFAAVEDELLHGPRVAPAAPAPAGGPEVGPSAAVRRPGAEAPGAPAVGQVFGPVPAAARAGSDPRHLLAAGLLGAAVALIGVLVGRRTR